MKTKWIEFIIRRSLFPGIMAAALVLVTVGCTKEEPEIVPDRIGAEELISSSINAETFWVNPERTFVDLLDGNVSLLFPAGTVTEPTEFTIATFPLGQVDLNGINMMKYGISIKNSTMSGEIENPFNIRIKYDLSHFLPGNPPVIEEDMTLYTLHHNVFNEAKIEAVKECCVDCCNKVISSNLEACGIYMVGEK